MAKSAKPMPFPPKPAKGDAKAMPKGKPMAKPPMMKKAGRGR